MRYPQTVCLNKISDYYKNTYVFFICKTSNIFNDNNNHFSLKLKQQDLAR